MNPSDEKDGLRPVYCVVWDDDTPHMDGSHPPRRMGEQTLELATQHLELVKSRSRNDPKRNLRIETRLVSDWQVIRPGEESS